MRFSSVTIWLGLKIRLMLAGLSAAVGCYYVISEQVLVRNFWPGVYSRLGMIFFFGLGMLFGLLIPKLSTQSGAMALLRNYQKNSHPIRFARKILAWLLCVMMVLFLLSLFVLYRIDKSVYVLPERFIFGEIGWNLLAFVVPAAVIGLIGIVTGLILDISFSLFIWLESPAIFNSNDRGLQSKICSVLCWILFGFAVGWAVGGFTSLRYSDRWWGLAMIPLIFCLMVILVSLIESSGELNFHPVVRRSVPEVVGRNSSYVGLSVVFLGWSAVWLSVHWKYALVSWVGTPFSRNEQILEVFFLAVISGIAGLKVAGRFFIGRKTGYLNIIDRQGLAVAIFGLGVMLSAYMVDWFMHSSEMSDGQTQAMVPFILILLSFLWGSAIGLSVPPLAFGCTGRFDLWIEFSGRLLTGGVLSVPCYLVWDWVKGGNFLAICVCALAGITVGGITLIYDDLAMKSPERHSKSGKLIHFFCVICLYLSLGIILLVVPELKAHWLRPFKNSQVMISEGEIASSALINNGTPSLRWANKRFPERTDLRSRDDLLEIAKKIINFREKQAGRRIDCLLVNLPFVSCDMFDSKINRLEQIDIDPALRKLELEFLHKRFAGKVPNFSKLYEKHKPYDLVIVFLPDFRKDCLFCPDGKKLLKRLLILAGRRENLWCIAYTNGKFGILSKTNIIYRKERE